MEVWRRRVTSTGRSIVVLALAGTLACEAKRERPPEPLVDLLELTPSVIELETRRHEFGVDDRGVLRDGWSHRTDRHRTREHLVVWADAEEARFELTVLRVEDKQVLVMLMAVPTTTAEQRVVVAVNGHPLGTFTVPGDDREIRFTIPGAVLRLGANELLFRHSVVRGSRNPRESRRYAAAYAKLLMGPACLRLRPSGDPEPPTVERGKEKRSIMITGPAAVTWSVDVPAGAAFATKLVLSGKSESAAEVILQARAGGEWVTLAETVLRQPWLLPVARARLAGDLAAFAGRKTELRLLVRPPSCGGMLTTIRLKRAAIALQTGERP